MCSNSPPACIQLPLRLCPELLCGHGAVISTEVTVGQAADGLDEGQGQPVPLVAGRCLHRVSQGTNPVSCLRCCGTALLTHLPPLALLHASPGRLVQGKWRSFKSPSVAVTSSNSSLSRVLLSREDAVTRASTTQLAAQAQPPGSKAWGGHPPRSLPTGLHSLGIPAIWGW